MLFSLAICSIILFLTNVLMPSMPMKDSSEKCLQYSRVLPFHCLSWIAWLIAVCHCTAYERNWCSKSTWRIRFKYCNAAFKRFYKTGDDCVCDCITCRLVYYE